MTHLKFTLCDGGLGGGRGGEGSSKFRGHPALTLQRIPAQFHDSRTRARALVTIRKVGGRAVQHQHFTDVETEVQDQMVT